ncbi:hypothetical protein NC653_029082 [Populus alba x Populus x berolinensis]|uniref:Uncharacterized protein n=1 Tax=Populus alba x Populus x berolinensis TaxID=444605 RepID=A0AAD6M178_9ROSI|nr:hypothetical protein NC653_029082 [Populus alba x Populus x berolinensis]
MWFQQLWYAQNYLLEFFVFVLHLQVMEMSSVFRVIEVIINFFNRVCSFGPHLIRNNVVFEAHSFLQGSEFWEVIQGVFIQGIYMGFVEFSLWKTHDQIICRSFEGPVECENRK